MTWAIFTMWSRNRPDLPITFWSHTGELWMRTPRNCTASRWELSPLWCGPHRLNSMWVGWAYGTPQ